MRLICIFASVAFLFSNVVGYAQVDFKHQFIEFTNNASQYHKEFTDSANTAFVKSLKSQWERFSIDSTEVRKRKPILDTVVIRSNQDNVAGISLPVSKTVTPNRNSFHAKETSLFNAESSNKVAKVINFSFYNTPVSIRVPNTYGSFHPENISEESVSCFWKKLAGSDYMMIVRDCNTFREELGLNDWAILKLTHSLAASVFPNDIASERTVFTVFLLNQMNLNAKVARADRSLVCLFPASQQIYGVKYILIDDSQYYIIGGGKNVSELYSYRTDFSKQVHSFDMSIKVPLSVGKMSNTVICDKTSEVFHATLHVPINESAMSFYDDYPQMDPIMYATAEVGERFNHEIIGRIKDLVRNCPNDFEKLSTILHFVQKDFRYKVDIEQFGREKPFFCEENFLYDYNDCEDRATLLSYLVRNVLGLRTLLIDYPDHMAIAVELPGDIRGDYVLHDGGRFYVCDPSYIDAPVGCSIPKYRTVPAKLWVAY